MAMSIFMLMLIMVKSVDQKDKKTEIKKFKKHSNPNPVFIQISNFKPNRFIIHPLPLIFLFFIIEQQKVGCRMSDVECRNSKLGGINQI